MAKYTFASHRSYGFDLDDKINEGGEGAIYRFGDDFLIKLFFNPTQEKADKVRHLSTGDRSFVGGVRECRSTGDVWAFPQDMVLDNKSGAFVGYVMQRIKNSWPISYLYDPVKINEEHLLLSTKSLATVLANMWEAVRLSHAVGFVLSDLTPANMMFSRKGRVKIIDIDSIQVSSDGMFFGSNVGTPAYLAPEISNGGDLNIKRHWYHDVFAAAAVSYQVMTGRHFTDGRVTSTDGRVPPNVAKRTKLCLWPYSVRNEFQGFTIDPPDDAVDFAMWGPALQNLFHRTFDAKKTWMRPTAKAWRNAFRDYASSLKACDDGAHDIYKTLRSCPWCELERRLA